MGRRSRIFNHEAAAALLLIALEDGEARNHDEIAYRLIDIHEGLAEKWSAHGGVRTTTTRYAYNNEWIAAEGSKYRITLGGFEYLNLFRNELIVTPCKGRKAEFDESPHRRRIIYSRRSGKEAVSEGV